MVENLAKDIQAEIKLYVVYLTMISGMEITADFFDNTDIEDKQEDRPPVFSMASTPLTADVICLYSASGAIGVSFQISSL